jgi:hypothetical protein
MNDVQRFRHFVGDCHRSYRDPFFPSRPWHLLACQDEAVNTLLASWTDLQIRNLKRW